MYSRDKNARIPTRARSVGEGGLSLLELLFVVAITVLVSAVSMIALAPALRSMHADSGVTSTLQVLRNARQMAIDQRMRVWVHFNVPAVGLHSITVTEVPNGPATVRAPFTIPLPADVKFFADAKFPIPPNTPDNIGTGKSPVDFEDAFSPAVGVDIYFMPDGSAQNAVANTVNGVVYLEQSNYWQGARAVTLFGATGRLHSYRLAQRKGGVYSWQ